MTDRKKPGVAFWITVALVAVLVGYPRHRIQSAFVRNVATP